MKNYIGVTGFKTPHEVREIAEFSEALPLPQDYSVMFGILAAHELMIEKTRSSTRFPATQDIPVIMQAAPNWGIPMVHYQTNDYSKMPEDVQQLFGELGESCNAVQLNMDWPAVSNVDKIKADIPNLEVLLCLTPNAMDGLSTKQIVDKTKQYGDAISYVLFDPSGGAGIPFSNERGAEMITALRNEIPYTIIGVAGGFSPKNVYDRVLAMRQTKIPFSIDAEGQIMPNGPLDMALTKAYIAEATRAYNV